MEGLKPPAGLDLLHGNLSENWRRFRQSFELYLTAAGGASKSAKVQSSLFLHIAGEEAVEVYNTLTFDEEDDRLKLAIILEKIEEYCNPRKNITYEMYKFFTCVQGDMSFNQYLTELKLKAKSCEFAQLRESLIRDRVVCGITSDTLRERLLREVDISLEKAAQLCLAAEITKVQLKQMHEEDHNAQSFASESFVGLELLPDVFLECPFHAFSLYCHAHPVESHLVCWCPLVCYSVPWTASDTFCFFCILVPQVSVLHMILAGQKVPLPGLDSIILPARF